MVGGLINAGQEVTTSAVDLALTGGYGTGNLAWMAKHARGDAPYDYDAARKYEQMELPNPYYEW